MSGDDSGRNVLSFLWTRVRIEKNIVLLMLHTIFLVASFDIEMHVALI